MRGSTAESRNGIKVGSRVVWQTPYSRLNAEVIEDRGNLGANGRRIWRILTLSEYPDARQDVEVAETDLRLADEVRSM